MQNNTAVIAQRMMNRQAPYGPVGMVSQNMSGNKKALGGGGGSGVIGLKFDIATATAGLTFSNNNITVINNTASATASAKSLYSIIPNTTNNWYFEFTVNSTASAFMGVGLPSFVCNTSNAVGIVANSVSYRPDNGRFMASGTILTTVASATTNDVIGFKLEVFNPGSFLTVLKNNVVIINQIDVSAYITDNSVAWTPIWSANQIGAAATISNNVYSYAGFTPIGTVTTVSASASVPAVADGKYDVYTFNASGTFTASSTGAVRALVIAGGGGGISSNVGAGGAGGYQEKGVVATPQTYTITVGGGGGALSNGNNSAFSTVTAIGGGYGGSASAGNGGGSGGGGGADFPGPTAFGGGSGTTDQGNSGGSGGSTGTNLQPFGGGGGGGAGGVGGNATVASGIGGNGGAGKASDITGVSITRAGGGGGGASATPGTATGGGGTQTSAATVNTGGGSGSNGPNMTGGSGVVIIRVRARA